MECAAQVTGGCFIDPGKKDADDAVNIGFPYADVTARRQRWCSASSKTPAGGSTCRRAPSRCSTRCTTRRATSRRTACSTSPTSSSRPRTGTACARPARRREAAHADLQGRRRLSRRLHRRRRSRLRRTERARAREARRADRARAPAAARLQLSRDPRRLHRHVEPARHGRRRPEPYEVRMRIRGAQSGSQGGAGASASKCARCTSTGPSGGGGGTNALREVLGVKSVLMPRELREAAGVAWRARCERHGLRPRPRARRRQGQHVERLGHRLRRPRVEHPARAAHRRARRCTPTRTSRKGRSRATSCRS